MRSMLITALSVAASGVMASELDVQPGQWALHLNSTDASYTVNTIKSDYNLSNTTDTQSVTTFSANLSGEYGLTEKITLCGMASVQILTTNEGSETDGTKTQDDSEKTTIYQASPFVRYNVTESVAIQAQATYLGVPTVVATDIDGNSANLTYSVSTTDLWLGFVYRTDLKPNVLMSFEGFGGIQNWEIKDDDEPVDTDTLQFYQAKTNLDFNYFLATNFSVNAGITATYRLLNAATDDGVDEDLSNVDGSQLDYGTRFGFTYYHR